MKKQILSILLIGFAGLASATSQTGKDNLTVDLKKSSLEWVGKKVAGEHKGGISLSAATLSLSGNKISGGKFTIDMNSMTCTDITDATYNAKLIDHLKNEDFFNTSKFSTAEFEISSVSQLEADRYEIKGKLTIKGVTNEVSFPASVKIADKAVVAVGKISVDRTKFDIKYGSKTIFPDLANKAIDDIFELEVKIIATK